MQAAFDQADAPPTATARKIASATCRQMSPLSWKAEANREVSEDLYDAGDTPESKVGERSLCAMALDRLEPKKPNSEPDRLTAAPHCHSGSGRDLA